MSLAHVASSSSFLPSPSLPPIVYVSAAKPATLQASSRFLPSSRASQVTTPFKCGTPLVSRLRERKFECQSARVSIKCEQGAKESGGLDVWLGRFAMIGFVTAIAIEIVTGKGILENFGFATPLPSFALVVTTLIGILSAVFIFQSATRE